MTSQLMHANHACCGGTAPGRLRPSSGGVTVGLGLLLARFFEKRGLRRGGGDHERGCGIGRRLVASQLMHANHACCGGTAPGRLRPSSGGVTVGLALLLARFLKNGACAVVVMATSAVAASGGDVWHPS